MMGESRQVQQSVRHEVAITCRDAAGRPHQLPTVHAYDPNEPFAVTIYFRARGLDLPWTFSREILALGQVAPVGDGDVRVWPGVSVEGAAVVMVRLSSPDGSLVVEALAEDIRNFLEATMEVVPRGTESERIDIDALIEDLLSHH